ncbi:nucleotidyl transferase AbiEii/AbiGii toxin family protein [Candidatus Micrarchaeota archaeon]|nr:nucleotidyl transferase AbiEii/AbiGii toxin family protein [Candidatus Micrarchaeota archaeon]MBU1165717.1 nucleotidyl transferase AbiEii/AbiGii toxin family protein [Candidatus Micrarchaeota archaeon]MBU1887084.1 nucleotidyl transferase AbiEii/AbiGii toxin family protein [Candidatus Micrarchaeota archaeon]
MIGNEELTNIARMGGMLPHQQEKHYVQTIVLKSLFSNYSNKLIFKGGTSLWFFHGLRRFSEDLDFTAKIDEINTKNITTQVNNDLALMGLENGITISEMKNSLSFRVGAKGPLFQGERGSSCFVSVDISFREKVILPYETHEYDPPYTEIGPFSVVTMDLKEISAEKIRAIMTREKARDVYDLFFLFRKGQIPDLVLINEKLSYYEKKFNYKEFEKELKKKKDIWDNELSSLIFGKYSAFKEVSDEILGTAKMLRNESDI